MAYKGSARIPVRRRAYKAPPRRYTRGAMGLLARRGLVPAGIASRVHQFKRVCQPMAVISAVAGNIPSVVNGTGGGAYPYLNLGSQSAGFVLNTLQFGGAMSFALSQCANASEITQLFDNYRIKKVILRFDYSQNNAPGSSAGQPGVNYVTSQAVPIIHVTPDFDDNGVPTNRIEVLQNAYTRTYRLDKSFTMALTPRAQTVVSNGQTSGSTAVGGLLSASTWLDAQSPMIPHFGVKFWLDAYRDWETDRKSTRLNSSHRL